MSVFIDHTEYSVSRDDFYILSILYPGIPIYSHKVFPMLMPKKMIYVGVAKAELYGTIINFSYGNQRSLANKTNVLSLLKKEKRMTERQEKGFMEIDGDEFWELMKMFLTYPKFALTMGEETASVFDLFCNIFVSFKDTYRIYRETGLNYRVLFSSLLTMMLKTQGVEEGIFSPGYKKILLRNKVHMPKYKGAVMNYLDSPQKEIDFIEFLYHLSGK